MRKSAKCVLATLLMFCFAGNVKAAECSYDKQVELNNQAATVKAIYEEVDIDTGQTVYDVDPNTGEIDVTKEIPYIVSGFTLKILNITKDIYISVEDNGNEKLYHYSDTDNGTLVLWTKEADSIYNYKIKVYGSSGDCNTGMLRSIDVKVPMYNWFSSLAICQSAPEFQYCQKYVTSELNITLDKFYSEINNYTSSKEQEKVEKKENKTFKQKIQEFYKENKKGIIIAISIVAVAGVATTAIIVVKRRSRLI